MVDADPYPWPYDGPVDASRMALVVAGAQRAWQHRSLGAAEVAAVVAAVAGAVRRAGGLVVHIRHGSASGGPVALPPAREHLDWTLVTDPVALDLVVDASGIDGFCGGPLDQALRSRRIDTLVLAGYGAETAVSSTLRSANDRGYECLTLSDGVAPFDVEAGRSTLHSITMSGGIFGAVAPSAALLHALSPLSPLSPLTPADPTPAEALR